MRIWGKRESTLDKGSRGGGDVHFYELLNTGALCFRRFKASAKAVAAVVAGCEENPLSRKCEFRYGEGLATLFWHRFRAFISRKYLSSSTRWGWARAAMVGRGQKFVSGCWLVIILVTVR